MPGRLAAERVSLTDYDFRRRSIDPSMKVLPQPIAPNESTMGTTPIGDTPICCVRLRIGGDTRNVYLKLEGHNPGGSIKDRTAMGLLSSLEVTGRLRSGGRLVESSSGNLAISLAMLARDRGYGFTAVVDPNVTAEKMRQLHALGAESKPVESPDETGGYLLSRLARVRKMLAEDPGLVWTDQYSNAANPEAHYLGTAPEIYRQMEHRVDAVFVAVSTGGTLAGIGRFFREVSPDTRIIAVDARGSVALGGSPGVRKLTGIGSGRRSTLAVPGLYDEVIYVRDSEAFACCRDVDSATGMKIGGSSGAGLAACARYLQTHEEVERPVCICADRGEHYASTIFSDSWLAQNGIETGQRSPGPCIEIRS